MTTQRYSRRKFLKTSALSAASLGLVPSFARGQSQTNTNARVRGANDDIRVAVIGFHGRGQDHLNSVRNTKGVRLVALCDVDSNVLDAELKKSADRGETVKGYQDIRKLLENDDIDAVTIATPNHWHSLAAIWAIQAGKDVYVEKPVSHEVWEGRQLVNAARKYNRIVQTGTQSRSSQAINEAIAWMREGNLGKIKLARGLCYKRRPSIGKTKGPQPVPPTVNYDLWCGPAPLDPLRRTKLHYDWHWVWPTGNGDLGNQGVHQMDIARWALGEPALSPRVFSIGGRLGYEDDGTTPNTLITFHDYPAAPLLFEVRGLPDKKDSDKMDKYRGESIGVVVDCEHGYMNIPTSYSKVEVFDKNGAALKTFEGGGKHFDNFIAAVRSRKSSDLHADILEGHVSSALCHTANISWRLGKKFPPEEIRALIRNDSEMTESFGRMEAHLNANGIDLVKAQATLGVFLKCDPVTEQFTNNHDANKLLTRKYRKPFVVPEKV